MNIASCKANRNVSVKIIPSGNYESLGKNWIVVATSREEIYLHTSYTKPTEKVICFPMISVIDITIIKLYYQKKLCTRLFLS